MLEADYRELAPLQSRRQSRDCFGRPGLEKHTFGARVVPQAPCLRLDIACAEALARTAVGAEGAMGRRSGSLLAGEVDLEVLAVNEGVDVAQPPCFGLATVLLGKREPGLHIGWGEDWLLAQLAEVDVPLVQRGQNGLRACLHLGGFPQLVHSDGGLAIGLHDQLVQAALQHVHLRVCKRSGPALLLGHLLHAEQASEGRGVTTQQLRDCGRRLPFGVPALGQLPLRGSHLDPSRIRHAGEARQDM